MLERTTVRILTHVSVKLGVMLRKIIRFYDCDFRLRGESVLSGKSSQNGW